MACFLQPSLSKSLLESIYPQSSGAYQEDIGFYIHSVRSVKCALTAGVSLVAAVNHLAIWIISSFFSMTTLGTVSVIENLSERCCTLTGASFIGMFIALEGVLFPSNPKKRLVGLEKRCDQLFFKAISDCETEMQASAAKIKRTREAHAVRIQEKVAVEHFFDPALKKMEKERQKLFDDLVINFPREKNLKYDAYSFACRKLSQLKVEHDKRLTSLPFNQKEVDKEFVKKCGDDAHVALIHLTSYTYNKWKNSIIEYGADFRRDDFAAACNEEYRTTKEKINRFVQQMGDKHDKPQAYRTFKYDLDSFVKKNEATIDQRARNFTNTPRGSNGRDRLKLFLDQRLPNWLRNWGIFSNLK